MRGLVEGSLKQNTFGVSYTGNISWTAAHADPFATKPPNAPSSKNMPIPSNAESAWHGNPSLPQSTIR